jgi:rhodanese-related sulfurtransferase
MKTVTPIELQKLLQSDPDLVLLDVRTSVEYAEAHVAEARNEPLHKLQPEKLIKTGALPGERPVFLLCQTGARASKAAERFAASGQNRGVVVQGGTKAWIEAGFPVTRATKPVMSLERQVRIAAGSLVLAGVLLGWLINPVFFGLSGFVGAGLIFAGVTDFCGMGLLLARMPWNNRSHA